MLNTEMIGKRITEARKKINFSQAELAQRLFISPQAVGKWERGESMPDITTLNRLAEIVGVDLNYFSETFHSSAKENNSDEPLVKPTIELTSEKNNVPAGKPLKKRSWDMSGGNWVDADFSGLKNLKNKFGYSNMQRCKFVGSELSGLLLEGNHIDGCDFSNSDLASSNFERSHLINNFFKNGSLKETQFSRSHMEGCNFTGTDLSGAALKSSSFRKNILTDAVLYNTSFIATDIADIVFEGKLEDCHFESCAFKNVTFQNSTLINTFFRNRSLKGIRFNNCKADRMTYEILKSGKADLTGITLLESQLPNE